MRRVFVFTGYACNTVLVKCEIFKAVIKQEINDSELIEYFKVDYNKSFFTDML